MSQIGTIEADKKMPETFPAETEHIPPAHADIPPPRNQLIDRLLRPSVRQALVVLFDQGGYSIATFLTGTLVARAAAKTEYATFVLGLTLVFFSGLIQRSLVAIPFSVLSQPLTERQRASYLGNSFVQHISLSILITLAFIIAWGAAQLAGLNSGMTKLFLPLVPFLWGV